MSTSNKNVLNEIIERCPFGIYIVDSSFRIAAMNNGSQNGAFKNVRPAVGRAFDEAMRIIWPEEVALEVIGHFRRTLTSGEDFYSRDFVRRRSDIDQVEGYEWELHRITLDDGQFGVICYYYDATKLRDTERALNDATKQLHQTLDTATIGLTRCSRDLRYISCNRAYAEIGGRTRDEIEGRTIADAMGNEWFEAIHPYIEQVLSGERVDFEIEIRLKDGRTKWVQVTYTPWLEDDGTVSGWVGSKIDVTKRVLIERELRESEQRFRAITTAMAEVVYRMSPDWSEMRYLDGRDFILDTREPSQRWLDKYIHPDDQPQVTAAISRAIDTKSNFELEHRVIRRDGTLGWTHSRAVPILSPAGEIIEWFGAAADITAMRHLAEERERLLDAERAARSEAERVSHMKDEFLATLSHELRTPLNAILGWSQILERGKADAATVREGVEVISRNARAQTQLIEDLLDMSRIISGKLRLEIKQVDIVPVAKAAIDAVTPAASAKDLRIEGIFDTAGGPISGDASRLQQVVWNLLTNAVKFTPKGGKIQVLVERVNSHIEISVSDTGQGIAAELLPHIFERFRQGDASASRKHGGLGIGLALVKQIAEMHGGSVRAKSRGKGEGATFTVALPLSIAKFKEEQEQFNAQQASTPEPCDPIDLAGVRVLFVDDDSDARTMGKRILCECNAEVTLAASAYEALRYLREQRPDVLVSDIGMPELDGYEFIRRVRSLSREQGGETPAAALTAFARSEDRRRALIAGYQSHIAKPVEAEELVTVVASLAGRTGRGPR